MSEDNPRAALMAKFRGEGQLEDPMSASQKIESTPDPEPANQDPAPEPSPAPAPKGNDKETNLRALANAKKELENKLKEIESQYQQTQSSLEEVKPWLDRRDTLAPLVDTIDNQFEGNPENFLNSIQTQQERMEDLRKLTESQEHQLQTAQLQSSQWYQENVKQPFDSAQDDIMVLADGAPELLSPIQEILNAAPNGSLTAADKKKFRAAVREVKGIYKDRDEETPDIPERDLMGAMDAFLKAKNQGLQALENKTKMLQEMQEEEAKQLVARQQEEINLKKNLAHKQAAEANHLLQAKLSESLSGLVPENVIEDSKQKSLEFLNGLFDSTTQLDYASAGQDLTKARMFDQLMESGRFAQLLEYEQRINALEREGAAPSAPSSHGSNPESTSAAQSLRERRDAHLMSHV